MKKYLLWMLAAALSLAGISCSDDPEVDSVGRVDIAQEGLTATGEGGDLTLTVTSNAYWRVEFTDPETGETIRWVSADSPSGTGDAEVTLTVARNRSTSARTAYVNVITESESQSAQVLLSQGAGTVGGGDGYEFPIYQMYGIDANYALDNAFVENGTCYFDDGMIVRYTGSTASVEFSTKTHTNPKSDWYFQRGLVIGPWATGDALEIEIPVKDELSGDLRYSFGSRRDGTQSGNPAWVFEWSGDGRTWTAFDGTGTGGASDAVWKTIDFTIPADKKIPAGGKLYIRHRCADGDGASTSSSNKTVAFQTGFCITRTEAEKSKLPAMDDKTVVFSTGFDELAGAKAAYIDLPLDFMSSWHAGAHSLPKEQIGIVAFEACYDRPGFLQVGNGDEAVITKYTQGSFTIKLASRFEAMRIAKCDLKLTFLASAMIDAYGKPTDPGVVVKTGAAGGATVEGGTLERVENNCFKPFTVYVRDATPETEITITSADMASSTDDVRFFVDDILVEVEGEPVRPDVNDPVKAAVADVRALKGTSAVTITDNLYIEARVTAVDNLPEGCFACQDADAGIVVKLPGHDFKAGDQVQVIVRDATLAADADGLLVVTPAAADKVAKTEAASEIPAARAITVADLAAGTYEAMYVSLPESQVVEGDLSKILAGNITLQTGEMTTTWTMKTYAGASFASQTVPRKRGVVKGLAGASFLLPTAAADLAAMTGTRFGEAVYAIKPISGILKLLGTGTELDFWNVSYADKTVTFSSPEGCSITKVGGGTADDCKLLVKAKSKNFYDGRFVTKGWGGDNWQENGLVFKIKATSRIVGNMRFGFGLFAANTALVPKNWKIVWSNDNTVWNEGAKILTTPFTDATDTFGLVTDVTKGGFKMAYFNVPENEAVAEGGYFYVKIMPADNVCNVAGQEVDPASGELIFQHGFYLTTHEKRAYHTSVLPSGAEVLLSEGFDDAFLGHDYFIPSWQFFTNVAQEYVFTEGWTKSGKVYEEPGYIRVEKSVGITTPAMTALGDATADITVKFKAAVLMTGLSGYTPDDTTLAVTVSGAGTIGSENFLPTTLSGKTTAIDAATASQMEAEYFRWYDCSAKISGATKETKITITGAGRHFIDEIVITKD